MKRFISHWRYHMDVSKEAEVFLLQRAQVVDYMAYDHFMQPGERKHYWCFVLKGLAFGYTLDADGRRSIHWFAGPMRGFTGVRHLHTSKGPSQAIQFRTDSTILRIPALHMRAAKIRYHEVSELLHLIHHYNEKQKDHLLHIVKQPNADARFAAFMVHFAEFARLTSPAEHMDFINMGRSSYYRAKNHYLHTRWSKK